MPQSPRSIAVVDIGATHSKVVLFNSSLQPLATRRCETRHCDGPPFPLIDDAFILAFVAEALRELDQIEPVDVVSVSAFGATIASLDGDGQLVLPIMDYLAEPPAAVAAAYERIAPPFSEVFCATAPMALSLGRQLFWLETTFPEEFARVTTLLPWSQYIAHRLGGRATSEISALGVFTQLLDVLNGRFSSLAVRRGWAERFAPLARAYDDIGELAPAVRGAGFRGAGRILCGVHDSNANYLRHLASSSEPFALLSTGTLCIGFNTATDLRSLDPAKDTFSFNDIFGRPVACCRFFGGREFELLLKGVAPDTASIAGVQRLVDNGVFALPSFSDISGPVPNRGNRGRFIGPFEEGPEERASLATIYVTLMMSELLDALGATADVLVDGPYARNRLFGALLAALRPGQRIRSSSLQEGTAAGAAVLALMGPDGTVPRLPVEIIDNPPLAIAGLGAYQARWRALIAAD